MDFQELLQRRFSLRSYSSETVPRELIDRCLEAARLAPSACNSQPWSFHVAADPEKTAALGRAAFRGIYGMNSFALKAPVLIAVVTERPRYASILGGLFRGVRFSLLDVGIACAHIALQAAELGLGTCLLGWFDEKAVKRELSLPGSSRIDIMISMGYPLRPGFLPPRTRKSLDGIRRFL